MGIYRLIYCSVASDPKNVDLEEILEASHSNNSADNITGMLVYSQGHFLQVIEGDRLALTSLFSRINSDPRHGKVELIAMGEVDFRLFPEWSMRAISVTGSVDRSLRKYMVRGELVPQELTPTAIEHLCMMQSMIADATSLRSAPDSTAA